MTTPWHKQCDPGALRFHTRAGRIALPTFVRSYVYKSVLQSESRLIEALSPMRGATGARRRVMRIKKAIVRRISHQYAARENLGKVVTEAVDELKAAGCEEAEISTALLELTHDVLAATGTEGRSLVTGRTNRQTISAEVRAIVDGLLPKKPERRDRRNE